jgi:hypothetical protein
MQHSTIDYIGEFTRYVNYTVMYCFRICFASHNSTLFAYCLTDHTQLERFIVLQTSLLSYRPHTTRAVLTHDNSNDVVVWSEEVPFQQTLYGSKVPKPLFLDSNAEIPAKSLCLNNFLAVRDRRKLLTDLQNLAQWVKWLSYFWLRARPRGRNGHFPVSTIKFAFMTSYGWRQPLNFQGTRVEDHGRSIDWLMTSFPVSNASSFWNRHSAVMNDRNVFNLRLVRARQELCMRH